MWVATLPSRSPSPSTTPPSFTSSNSTTFLVGTRGNFTPTANGYPAPTFTESGALPTGVTFTHGSLEGMPTQTGSFPITFTASGGGTTTQSFTLTVDQAPAITSANAATFSQSAPGTFTVTSTGTPTPTLSEFGNLPSGVTFTPHADGTGTLAGTPARRAPSSSASSPRTARAPKPPSSSR